MVFTLTHKGYKIKLDNLNNNELNEIKKELTVEPMTIPGYGDQNVDNSFKLYKMSDNYIYVPRNYGYQKYGEINKSTLSDGETINCQFNGTLRDYQNDVINSWKTNSPKYGNCGIIALKPGGGKTVITIALIGLLKVKAIILVHNSDLLNQWIERLNYFLPTAKVGIIRGKKCQIDGYDVVIGMIQSISNPKKDKQYPRQLFNDFGLLIVDECHHIGAKVFSRCLLKIQTKYIIGLSATPERQDGLTRVIKYFLGDIVFNDTQVKKTLKEKEYDHIPDCEARIYNYVSNNIKYNKEITNFRGKPDFISMETNIIKCKQRTNVIYNLLPDLITEGRNILIITSRKDHVYEMLEYIENNKIASCGPYVGGLKNDILLESKKCRILVGTYKMVSEGFDCDKLDTLILASPKKSLRQVSGRIMRKEKHKRILTPVIIDINDDFSLFTDWCDKRKKYYLYYNFKIVEYNVNYNDENCHEPNLNILLVKEYEWPVSKKDRPKSIPDVKQGQHVSKLIKTRKANNSNSKECNQNNKSISKKSNKIIYDLLIS